MKQKTNLIITEANIVWKSFVRTEESTQWEYLTMKKKRNEITLTDEENKSYEEQKVCYICKKEFNTD